MDIVRRIRDFNAWREPERLQMKYDKMSEDAFVFLRGSCHLFYDRLPSGGVFKSAPRVWVCGDLHLENFGSYKGDNRLAYFDVNDFDEAALAPATWDLVRLLTSARLAAETVSLSHADANLLCSKFLKAYAEALTLGKAFWLERDTATGLVGKLLDDLRTRERGKFIAELTSSQGKRRVLKTGKDSKLLEATGKQQQSVIDFMQGFSHEQKEFEPGFFEVIDVARRVAGTGSLGVTRYAILVKGKGSPDGNYLLDLKQVMPSSLVPHLKVAQPAWPSESGRAVDLQRRAQARSMAFLHAVRFGKLPCTLRGLQPEEDRVSLERKKQSMPQREELLVVMGRLVAWSHLRSAGRQGSAIADELIDFGQRKKWQAVLLEASEHCADQVRKDWKTYRAAFDDKVFEAG